MYSAIASFLYQFISRRLELIIKAHKTIILPVVLHGCAILSPTVREEHGLKLFDNRVLRRIFRPKEKEVAGGWKNMHNEELHNYYSSASTIRMITSRSTGSAGHAERIGEIRNSCNIFVGKPEAKRPLGR
jgi:hypothetical protein